MTTASDFLLATIHDSIETKQCFAEANAEVETFSAAVDFVVARYRTGGRLYIAGNGGSAADAQHLAAEFVSKLACDRAPLPAEALTVDSPIFTAIGNDYGFDQVFSRQLRGKATSKDVFLGITTSRMSQNIAATLQVCKKLVVPSIVFAGRDGEVVKGLADCCVVVPGSATSTIQELHIVLAHTLCQSVENALF